MWNLFIKYLVFFNKKLFNVQENTGKNQKQNTTIHFFGMTFFKGPLTYFCTR